MKKICMITTVSLTLKSFVVETAKYLHDKCGYDVTLVCSEDDKFTISLPDYIHFFPIHMARGIDVFAIRAIREFRKLFRREKFDLIQYSTPNAAFYASVAAKSIKAPIRLYCQWGIRYVGMSGINRLIFKSIEKIVCQNSTDIRSVSPMNMQFGLAEGLYPEVKVKVVGNGGTIGVDMKKYSIDEKKKWRKKIRKAFDIAEDDFVFGFVGRVSVDKGCRELFAAFKSIRNPKAKLLIVGPFDDNCGIDDDLVKWARKNHQIKMTGLVGNANMREYYAAMDMLIHPTYREGFSMVIQEAGALAVPAITTRIPGASEVMVDEESCLLVEPKNVDALAMEMGKCLDSGSLVLKLSDESYKRTSKLYDRAIMLENQRIDYEELLSGERK